jgi:hypothetical protein
MRDVRALAAGRGAALRLPRQPPTDGRACRARVLALVLGHVHDQILLVLDLDAVDGIPVTGHQRPHSAEDADGALELQDFLMQLLALLHLGLPCSLHQGSAACEYTEAQQANDRAGGAANSTTPHHGVEHEPACRGPGSCLGRGLKLCTAVHRICCGSSMNALHDTTQARVAGNAPQPQAAPRQRARCRALVQHAKNTNTRSEFCSGTLLVPAKTRHALLLCHQCHMWHITFIALAQGQQCCAESKAGGCVHSCHHFSRL